MLATDALKEQMRTVRAFELIAGDLIIENPEELDEKPIRITKVKSVMIAPAGCSQKVHINEEDCYDYYGAIVTLVPKWQRKGTPKDVEKTAIFTSLAA